MKILYEVTYAFRGKSGIPRDTASVARILGSLYPDQLDLLVCPLGGSGLHNSRKWTNLVKIRGNLGRGNKESLNILMQFPMSIYEILTMNRRKPLSIPPGCDNQLLSGFSDNHSGKVLVTRFSYFSRFLRSKLWNPFRVNTGEYSIFIQQQIDPIRVSRKTIHVARLHDIIPLTHPHFFSSKAVDIFSESLRKMLRYVDWWVVDSEFTRSELNRFFGEMTNIYVAPCGVPEIETDSDSNKINQVLIVGTVEPRKNIRVAVEGFLYAIEKGLLTKDWVLKVCGSNGWLEDSLYNSLKINSFGNRVKFVDSPNSEQLKKYYQESKLILSTSHVEGFGLTPLEGMQHQCLPVVSDIPAHREILGDLPIFIENHRRIDSVASALTLAANRYEQDGLPLYKALRDYVNKKYSESASMIRWGEFVKENCSFS